MHDTKLHSNKYIQQLPNKPTATSMHCRQVWQCIYTSEGKVNVLVWEHSADWRCAHLKGLVVVVVVSSNSVVWSCVFEDRRYEELRIKYSAREKVVSR